MSNSGEIKRVNILGVHVSAINLSQALETIDEWITHRERHYICVRDVHGVMKCQKDEELRSIHDRAGLVTPDGMPLVWLNRLHGQRHVGRVYGPDLMRAVFAISVGKGYRHFLYGGNEGVAETLAEKLKQRFPGVQIMGTFCPPFRDLTAQEDSKMIRTINQAQADIVWVGLSTPKQEHWMAKHTGLLNAPVLIGVGAAFDFLSDNKKQAPKWMQRSGLEWLFRLFSEPQRLWKRYLTTIPKFIFLTCLQLLGLKKY